MGSCEPSDVGARKANVGPMQEQYMPLPTEPSPQPRQH